MEDYIIIILIFGFLILGLLVVIFFINRLLLYKKEVDNQFQTVVEQLEARIELLEKMVSFVEKNVEHEEILVKEMTNCLEKLQNVHNSSEESIEAIKKSTIVLEKFTDLSTVYPFLKNKTIYQELRKEFLQNQDRVTYAMEFYDRGAKIYNTYKEKKGVVLLSKLFRFSNYVYYNEKQ